VVEEGADRKEFLPEDEALGTLEARLEAYQEFLLERALARREANSYRGVRYYEEMKEILERGGFVYAGWNGTDEVEARVKEETGATIRLIPDEEFASADAPERCIVSGDPAKREAVWAKAY
jgi:prolyl-tRNA synthetase